MYPCAHTRTQPRADSWWTKPQQRPPEASPRLSTPLQIQKSCPPAVRTRLRACVRAWVHQSSDTRTHAHTHACMHACTHAHAYICVSTHAHMRGTKPQPKSQTVNPKLLTPNSPPSTLAPWHTCRSRVSMHSRTRCHVSEESQPVLGSHARVLLARLRRRCRLGSSTSTSCMRVRLSGRRTYAGRDTQGACTRGRAPARG
jgi:hypothetical protein